MGMWIGTGGLSDHWGLAHEFMHGVQSVEGGLACNQSNTCGWIYESHANWAAQQQVGIPHDRRALLGDARPTRPTSTWARRAIGTATGSSWSI
jgi:hypothetical protein